MKEWKCVEKTLALWMKFNNVIYPLQRFTFGANSFYYTRTLMCRNMLSLTSRSVALLNEIGFLTDLVSVTDRS